MSEHEAVDRLLNVLAPLVEDDYCEPYSSAWELCPYGDAKAPDGSLLDGEDLHKALVEAVAAVKQARQTA